MKKKTVDNRAVMKRILKFTKPYSLFIIISFLC